MANITTAANAGGAFAEMAGFSTTYLVAGALVTVVSVLQYVESRKRDIDVPAVGPTGRLSSYWGALRFIFKGHEMLMEGYYKNRNGVFKFPELERWHVVVNSPQLIEEVRKAPDHVLSFAHAVDVTLAVPWTLGRQISEVPYHIPIIRAQLTRNLGVLFDDVRDEIVHSFVDAIPLNGDEWTSVPAYETMMDIVCRTSNRIFIGLPVCRDPEWRKLAIGFTIDVVAGGKILNLFPPFLRNIVGELITSVPRTQRKALKHLAPIIEERQRKIAEYGKDYPDKPNDMLAWFMDEAQGEETTVKSLTLRILTVNFAAIHTSSMSFTHALFHLAAQPEYIEPMREEVERVLAEEGWNKIAMTKMRRLDSFLKESARFTGIGDLSMTRVALQDTTLSNGTRLPKGTFVSAAGAGVHHDTEYYAHADEFDGFRFAELRDESGEGTKHQMVATSAEYLPFGHGRHACPGRFFAANELKAMLAHVVLNYDVKTEPEGVRPPDGRFHVSVIPNTKAHVLFRRRQERKK